MRTALKQVSQYHEWTIYREYVEQARLAGFNRFEYADHEETFRREAAKGEHAVYGLLCEQTRFLRECNRSRKCTGPFIT
jgi:hypothetical protein